MISKKLTAVVASLLCLSICCALVLTGVSGADAVYGDADGNSDVTAADARLVLRMAVSLDPLPDDIRYVDVDADGGVTAADARLVLRKAVNLESVFPAETKDAGTASSEQNSTALSTTTLPAGGSTTTQSGSTEPSSAETSTRPVHTTRPEHTTKASSTTEPASKVPVYGDVETIYNGSFSLKVYDSDMLGEGFEKYMPVYVTSDGKSVCITLTVDGTLISILKLGSSSATYVTLDTPDGVKYYIELTQIASLLTAGNDVDLSALPEQINAMVGASGSHDSDGYFDYTETDGDLVYGYTTASNGGYVRFVLRGDKLERIEQLDEDRIAVGYLAIESVASDVSGILADPASNGYEKVSAFKFMGTMGAAMTL